MKRSIIIILLFLNFCSSPFREINPPEDLIGQELMSKIMLDVMLMKNINRNGYAIKEKRNILVDQYILQKYGVDSFQFNKSQDFYLKNPKEYNDIFEIVQSELNVLRDSLRNIEIEEND